MACELCGKKEANYRISIEGAEMDVCESCAKHGKVLKRSYSDITGPVEASAIGGAGGIAGTGKTQSVTREPRVSMESEMEIIPNYAERIRNACNRLGISHHVLAERLSEKESYMDKVMQGRQVPDEKTARKIEKELHIALFESSAETVVKTGKMEKATLGDVIYIEKKNKK